MSFLLDTCTLSELVKPAPNPALLAWFAEQDELTLHIATVSVGELMNGIARLAAGKRKKFLGIWLRENVVERFGERVLPLSLGIALRWGELQAKQEKRGKPQPAIDGLIAATAIHHRLAVVTRNIGDMEASGVTLINPWRD